MNTLNKRPHVSLGMRRIGNRYEYLIYKHVNQTAPLVVVTLPDCRIRCVIKCLRCCFVVLLFYIVYMHRILRHMTRSDLLPFLPFLTTKSMHVQLYTHFIHYLTSLRRFRALKYYICLNIFIKFKDFMEKSPRKIFQTC